MIDRLSSQPQGAVGRAEHRVEALLGPGLGGRALATTSIAAVTGEACGVAQTVVEAVARDALGVGGDQQT